MVTSRVKLLICGQGYLGKEIAKQANEKKAKVFGATLNGFDGCLACDLGDEPSVAALRESVGTCDAVIHCASSGRGGADAYERVYLGGMRHLVKFFPEAKLLFTSSTSVYGQTDGSWVTEESAAVPDRQTGKFLLAAENATLEVGGIVCRLSGIYGPGRSVILKKFLLNEAVIEEDGRRFLNQIHRNDAAAAVLHLIETQQIGVFNVSDDKPTSQLATYQGLARIFGKPLPPVGERDLERKRGWTHKQVSNQKIRSTGWSPCYGSFLDAAVSLTLSAVM